MKKLAILFTILIIAGTFSFAQEDNLVVGEPNAETLSVDAAQQKLQEVSISKFEDAGFWRIAMPLDYGIASIRRLPGGPLDKEPLEEEEELGIAESEQDRYVLGAKVQYFKRALSYVQIFPARPLPIEGICKTVSVWVVGRNQKHNLVMMVEDHFGNYAEVNMGTLNFTGWKKMTVAIPPSIVQQDYHYANRIGIRVTGFRIDFNAEDTYGNYYVYLDDLRAVTDLFPEEVRDTDDMQDNW